MKPWDVKHIRQYPGEDTKACIVFIHGFGGDVKKTWGKFPDLMREDKAVFGGWDIVSIGYPSGFLPDLLAGWWSAKPDIPALTGALVTAVKHELGRYDTFAIIAHSMGGLIVQKALVDASEFCDKVQRVVLFGTPSGGLIKAQKAKCFTRSEFHRAAVQMAKGSPFLEQLRADWKGQGFLEKPPFYFINVAGYADNFVPKTSSHNPFRKAADQPANTYGPRVALETVPGHHLQIVKPRSKKNMSYKVVRNWFKSVHVLPKVGSGRVDLQRAAFRAKIRQWKDGEADLDEPTRIELALAYDATGDRDRAIMILELVAKPGSDTLGTLGGRYKRRWRGMRQQADYKRAVALYKKAYYAAKKEEDLGQLYYAAINRAYLYRVMGGAHPSPSKRAKWEEWANLTLEYCAEAKKLEMGKPTMWRLASEAEAHLILEDTKVALEKYRAVRRCEPETWQLSSTFDQAIHLCQVMEDAKTEAALRNL